MSDRSILDYRSSYGTLPFVAKGIQKADEKLHAKFSSLPGIDLLCYRSSERVLDTLKDREETIGDRIQTTHQYSGFGLYKSIRPQQIRYELHQLVEKVIEKEPKRVVEIGTAEGGTLYVLSRSLPSLQQTVSIDLPGGIHGGGYPSQKTKFYDGFAPNVDSTFIRGDSHKHQTKEQLKNELRGGIDFLFIDGDHTYEGVKRDFRLYKDLVSEGGLIAFHDIVEHKYDDTCQVDRFWQEIKDSYETMEIISHRETQTWAGIGVVQL